MAGSLVLIQETTLTTPTASVVLTGIDSTYNVYMVKISNVQPVTDNKNIQMRVTKSGTAQSDSEYDFASKQLFASTSFVDNGQVNQTSFIDLYIGNNTGEMANGLMYLYNFNNSSEFSFVTREQVSLSHVAQAQGVMGGGVHTVASASDGVNFHVHDNSNITSGTFTLYKVI